MSHAAEAENGKNQSETSDKKKKHRSPAYPYINLETAELRCKQFFKEEQRGVAHLTVAAKHWGYDEKSSAALQTAAALISFGLMQDSGSGDSRTVRLSQSALRLVLDTDGDSPDRISILKEAALSPKIHKELWTKYSGVLPSDAQLKRTLLFEWEPPFNHNSVDGFIKEFRDTIAFAKLSQSDTVATEVQDGGSSETFKVGDYVQWESNGQLQFDKPRKIIGFYESGWAKVEGTGTGIPLAQLTKEKPPAENPGGKGDQKPPLTPPHVTLPPKSGMNQDVFTLEEGDVTIQWPKALSEASYQDLEDWLELIKRKAKRAISKGSTGPDASE